MLRRRLENYAGISNTGMYPVGLEFRVNNPALIENDYLEAPVSTREVIEPAKELDGSVAVTGEIPVRPKPIIYPIFITGYRIEYGSDLPGLGIE